MILSKPVMNKAKNTLSRAAAKAGLSSDEFDSMRNWLVEQLRANEYAKLSQGGHTEADVPLGRVFVDLPVASGRDAVAHQAQRTPFLKTFFASVPLRLDAGLRDVVPGTASVELCDSDLDGTMAPVRGRGNKAAAKALNACILVGGPGQGKSTLSQLACQLHRAALLMPLLAQLGNEPIRDLVRSFDSAANLQQSDIPRLPKQALLPLQIALPEFATWFAKEAEPKGSAPALLRFLAAQPGAQACGLTAPTLLSLLGHLPALLVLDGFDEVGASSERENIVLAARELLTVLASLSGKVKVIATTRPQGYAGELAGIGVEIAVCYLLLLREDEALAYAQKLVEAKSLGADKRQKMQQRLEEAASDPSARRLLTTPLQVTILAALVQQLGRIPRERWNLFMRYFTYTYDREIERGTYASALLADQRGRIEKIHTRVALLLQVDAEREGGANARMTRSRFLEVIEAVLIEDEVAAAERESLVLEIAIAAEQRLVFLVEPEPGNFGFEIRSLQEFLAAWTLSNGREDDVKARVQQIAKSAMFRNVLLFITSRWFSEGSALRDFILEVCAQLDESLEDVNARETKAGAFLALEILEEGAALAQPKYAKLLMARAVALLVLPPDTLHIDLLNVCNGDTELILKQSIEAALDCKNDAGVPTAWLCLGIAAYHHKPWAKQLVARYWHQFSEENGLLGRFLANESGQGPSIAGLERREQVFVLANRILFYHQTQRGETWAMRRELDRSKTGLDNHATWNRLGLPFPLPALPIITIRSAANKMAENIPSLPVHIDSLEVRDIRGLQHLALPFSRPAESLGQWVVILGPNGAGKTTLLRSLALGLRNATDLSIWPEGVFDAPWPRRGADGEELLAPPLIAVKLGNGKRHQTEIRQNGSLTIIQNPPFDSPRLFPVFAYGCRRGSALGGAAREVALEKPGTEIATLFDEGADLIQAETWLKELHGDTYENPQSAAIFTAVVAALETLLNVEKITVRDKKVWVNEHGMAPLPFASLSDGYLTSAGWFIDLIARWAHMMQSKGIELSGNFMQTMRGLVLVDEIDLHLHPQWQIEIISRTRKLLPQMSFVVTTHNPLTLVGAKAEEIWILRNEGGKVEARKGTETPMLLTGGEIYASYFGIDDIYPDGLGRKLQRFGFLSGYAMRSDEDELEVHQLQAQLRERGIDPGWEIIPRQLAPESTNPPPKVRKPRVKKHSEV